MLSMILLTSVFAGEAGIHLTRLQQLQQQQQLEAEKLAKWHSRITATAQQIQSLETSIKKLDTKLAEVNQKKGDLIKSIENATTEAKKVKGLEEELQAIEEQIVKLEQQKAQELAIIVTQADQAAPMAPPTVNMPSVGQQPLPIEPQSLVGGPLPAEPAAVPPVTVVQPAPQQNFAEIANAALPFPEPVSTSNVPALGTNEPTVVPTTIPAMQATPVASEPMVPAVTPATQATPV